MGSIAVKRSDDAGRASTATVMGVSIIVALLLVLPELISCDDLFADLRFADLRFADLRFADLRFADLRFANLLGGALAAESQPSATGSPPPVPEAGCRDDLPGSRASAAPRVGAESAVFETVTLVCWEPSGALRVESRLPPTSARTRHR